MDGTSVTNSVIIACCVIDDDDDDDDDTSLFCFCCGILLLCIFVDNDEGGANASVFDVANMAVSTIVRDRILLIFSVIATINNYVATYDEEKKRFDVVVEVSLRDLTLDSVLHS